MRELFPSSENILQRLVQIGICLVFDPFGGIGTTPLRALMAGRRGLMTELNPDYFRDAVGYLNAEEAKIDTPTLFDYLGIDA